jgi:hypothetical protein
MAIDNFETRGAATFTLTTAASSNLTPAFNFYGWSKGILQTSGSQNMSDVAFYSSPTETGTYQLVLNSGGSAARCYQDLRGAGWCHAFPAEVSGAQWLKIGFIGTGSQVHAVNQDPVRTINVSLKG